MAAAELAAELPGTSDMQGMSRVRGLEVLILNSLGCRGLHVGGFAEMVSPVQVSGVGPLCLGLWVCGGCCLRCDC